MGVIFVPQRSMVRYLPYVDGRKDSLLATGLAAAAVLAGLLVPLSVLLLYLV